MSVLPQKKVIFVLWRDKPGGIEVLLPDIVANFPTCQFSAFIFRPNDDKNSVFANLPVTVKYGSFNNFMLYLRFFYFAVQNRLKLFHVFNIGPIMFLLLRMAGVKKILYSIHGTIYWKTRIRKLLLKICWWLAVDKESVFTANSAWSKKVFCDQVSAKAKTEVVYNPINTKRFNCNTRKPIQPYKIIYAGRLVSGKNLFKWLDCAKEILLAFPKTLFVLYGDGPLKQALEDYSQLLGIAEHVIFHGFKKDIENAYKTADLLLFLSEYESFGNVVVESILCGSPVIASDIPSIQEIFRSFPEFIVPLDVQLEEKIIAKIAQLPELKTAAFRASAEFQHRFSLKQHVQKIETIYNSF